MADVARAGAEHPIHAAYVEGVHDVNLHDLVDEINLLTFPVVVGQGTGLFPDTGRDRALGLIESGATPPELRFRSTWST